MLIFLAHLSRRLVGELIVYPWSGVRPLSTISNKNISATSRLIATKFYLKHHWVGGKAARGFGPDRIRTLVSMATESSHRVIMEKTVYPLFLSCFSSDPFHTCRIRDTSPKTTLPKRLFAEKTLGRKKIVGCDTLPKSYFRKICQILSKI